MLITVIIIWYLFMFTFSFRGLESLKIGFDYYWYHGDRRLFWASNAVFLSIVWPLTWLLILFNKGSRKIIKLIEQEYQQ